MSKHSKFHRFKTAPHRSVTQRIKLANEHTETRKRVWEAGEGLPARDAYWAMYRAARTLFPQREYVNHRLALDLAKLVHRHGWETGIPRWYRPGEAVPWGGTSTGHVLTGACGLTYDGALHASYPGKWAHDPKRLPR